MTTFPRSPKVARGGIVLLDADSGQVQRVVALQYNPETLSRTLRPKHLDDAGGSRALRLTGPATETLRVEAELDATDQLEEPDQHAAAVAHGIQPQLATLEALVQPGAAQLTSNHALAAAGTLEIVPMQGPLPVFVWSASRIVPVRITEVGITEEAFDVALNPIRATVTLSMQVLTVDDLGFEHKGGSLFMTYLQTKERLAGRAVQPGVEVLGIGGIG